MDFFEKIRWNIQRKSFSNRGIWKMAQSGWQKLYRNQSDIE